MRYSYPASALHCLKWITSFGKSKMRRFECRSIENVPTDPILLIIPPPSTLSLEQRALSEDVASAREMCAHLNKAKDTAMRELAAQQRENTKVHITPSLPLMSFIH